MTPPLEPFDLFDPDTWPDADAPSSIFVDDDQLAAEVQLDLFAAAGQVSDLPLFSGTAPHVTERPFVERPTPPTQGRLDL